jgi:hypothetical protein
MKYSLFHFCADASPQKWIQISREPTTYLTQILLFCKKKGNFAKGQRTSDEFFKTNLLLFSADSENLPILSKISLASP